MVVRFVVSRVFAVEVGAIAVPGEVRDGADAARGHFHQDDRAPSRVVLDELLFERTRSHVLEVHVDGGDHVEAVLGFDHVVLGRGNPNPATGAHLQLLPFDAVQRFVPARFHADLVGFAVDADGPSGQRSEGLEALVLLDEHESAAEPALADERQLAQCLHLEVGQIPAHQFIPRAPLPRLAQPVLEGRRAAGSDDLRQSAAQAVQSGIERLRVKPLHLAVPAQFIHRH